MHSNFKHRRAGFTVIEMLLSLMLLAASVSLVLSGSLLMGRMVSTSDPEPQVKLTQLVALSSDWTSDSGKAAAAYTWPAPLFSGGSAFDQTTWFGGTEVWGDATSALAGLSVGYQSNGHGVLAAGPTADGVASSALFLGSAGDVVAYWQIENSEIVVNSVPSLRTTVQRWIPGNGVLIAVSRYEQIVPTATIAQPGGGGQGISEGRLVPSIYTDASGACVLDLPVPYSRGEIAPYSGATSIDAQTTKTWTAAARPAHRL